MKKTVVALSSLLLLSLSAQAKDLSGIVLDHKGQPIVNAMITVVGSRVNTRTDEDGRFALPTLPERAHELHVSATGYSHRVVHLEEVTTAHLELSLQPTVLHEVDVFSLPIHASSIESVQPISVIPSDALRAQSAATLGETLKDQVGIHSSYYGPVSSSPIIRGLDGPRVLIAQNGLDVGDASRVGPDHLVSTETSSAEQVEILRGPATLFYGTGAIGGVINVVDDRVPQDSTTKAHFITSHNGVNDETQMGFGLTSGTERFAYHISSHWREGNDYHIPARHTETGEKIDKIDNSDSSSRAFNVGASYLLENGFIGFSYGNLNTQNGVPGHSHEETKEHHEESNEHHEEEHHNEEVRSKLDQDRWQFISEIDLDSGWLHAINTKVGYTTYQHRELHLHDESDHVNGDESLSLLEQTVFDNKTLQGRVDFLHRELLWDWRGALSLEYKHTDLSSIGAEAFTSPSKTQSWSLALIEEKHVGNLLWQLGARIEQVSIDVDPVHLPSDGHHNHTGHDDEPLNLDTYKQNPYSLSAGFVWDFTPGYKIATSITHAQRSPSAAELFSIGPHIGTRSYEIGALYELHAEEDGGFHFHVLDKPKKETSNNIDISLRKHEGQLGFVINAFYNEIRDYYYQAATGLNTHDVFEHEDHTTPQPGVDHQHESDLPIYQFRQADAELYGLELELIWQPAEYLRWTLWGDTLHAELKSGEYLPRTPPKRLGAEWLLQYEAWTAKLNMSHTFKQDHTASYESSTDSYQLINAEVSHTWHLDGFKLTAFAQGENLTNEYAQVHTSFIKEIAPLPGRALRIGLRGSL